MKNTTLNNWDGCDAYQREGEKQMSDVDIIYLAGFIDGEGCVTIDRYKRRGKQNFYYKAQLDICNTNRDILEWIKERFGGCIVAPRHAKGKRATCYRVTFNDWKCVDVLRLVLPYLKVKNKEALIVIYFQKNLKYLPRETRDNLYRQVRILKTMYKNFLHPQRLNGLLLDNKDEAIVQSNGNRTIS